MPWAPLDTSLENPWAIHAPGLPDKGMPVEGTAEQWVWAGHLPLPRLEPMHIAKKLVAQAKVVAKSRRIY